jgi:hypothetical protein
MGPDSFASQLLMVGYYLLGYILIVSKLYPDKNSFKF